MTLFVGACTHIIISRGHTNLCLPFITDSELDLETLLSLSERTTEASESKKKHSDKKKIFFSANSSKKVFQQSTGGLSLARYTAN